MDAHKANDCARRMLPCALAHVTDKTGRGCDLEIAADRMRHHVTWECRNRRMYCPLGCGQEMHGFESKAHRRLHCPERWCTCKYDGCGVTEKAKFMVEHETKLCFMRPEYIEAQKKKALEESEKRRKRELEQMKRERRSYDPMAARFSVSRGSMGGSLAPSRANSRMSSRG